MAGPESGTWLHNARQLSADECFVEVLQFHMSFRELKKKRNALITIADREWPPRVWNVWKFLMSSRLSAVRRVASVEVKSKTKISDVCTVYCGNLFH